MQRIYTVTQINNYIKNMFNSDYLLQRISLKGEVSNCKYHSSGHIYFTLKDDQGAMRCVMFASSRKSGLSFQLADGQSVVVSGSISVYERDGTYQCYVKSIKFDGQGALFEEYERLKEKLFEEGLFDFELKKEITKTPKSVGIVTARTGAAIQDIINIAKRRNPYVQLILYPAKVQGDGAADTIVRGIETLDRMDVDTIIIGRGGGSIEDLWAFNEEKVARAIFNAKTPIISGTGHEIDNTIADYAADLRAPTPSAACELAIPDYKTIINQLNDSEYTLNKIIREKIFYLENIVAKMELKLQLLNPENVLREKRQNLIDLENKMNLLIKQKLINMRYELRVYTERLNGLSPTKRLINGFGYISTLEDKPIKSVEMIKVQDAIKVTLVDGDIKAIVTDIVDRR